MTDEAQSAPKREDLRELQRRVHSAAQPFIKLKVDIMKRALPTMRLYPDGHFESSYPPEIVELLAKIDALWHRRSDALGGITMRGWMGGRGQFDDGDEDVVCYCSCHDRGFSCCPLCPIAHETRETEMRCPHCGASYVEFHMCRDTQENDDLRKEDL